MGCEGSFLGLGAAKGSICKLFVGWLIEDKDWVMLDDGWLEEDCSISIDEDCSI